MTSAATRSHRHGTSARNGGDFTGNRRDYADPTRGQRLGLDSGPDDWSDTSNRASRDFGRDREFNRGSGWQGYAGGAGSPSYGGSPALRWLAGLRRVRRATAAAQQGYGNLAGLRRADVRGQEPRGLQAIRRTHPRRAVRIG